MSTGPLFVTEQAVRDYLALNATDVTSKYSSATINSNIRVASWTLERATGRQLADQTATTKTFTTEGRALVPIPGLRTATSVTLAGSALTADETYWLIPDVQQTGQFVAIQFRSFDPQGSGRPWWYGHPEWFDRGYDLPGGPWRYSSLPNDLVILGSWGYPTPYDTGMPEPILHATKVLAAFYTLRPQALLSGAVVTPEGGGFDIRDLPIEVSQFIHDWRLGERVVSV